MKHADKFNLRKNVKSIIRNKTLLHKLFFINSESGDEKKLNLQRRKSFAFSLLSNKRRRG